MFHPLSCSYSASNSRCFDFSLQHTIAEAGSVMFVPLSDQYQLIQTQLFVEDLERLPKHVQKQVHKQTRFLQSDPRHNSLETHLVWEFPSGRQIFEAYVNRKEYRLLWERLERSKNIIALWRVVTHDLLNDAQFLPEFNYHERPTLADAASPDSVQSAYLHGSLGPFQIFKDNHLRLFGVPDDKLQIVKQLSDPEQIWDLDLADGVKNTLADILTHPDWLSDALFAPEQLLYRANVDQLEGYCEGKIRKLLLNLSPDQERLVDLKARGPILIKGSAGSGKTTVGLYRAKRIAEARSLFGDPSVLILTYTITLANVLRELLCDLYGDSPPNIEVNTFRDWMKRYLFQETDAPIITDHKRKTVLGPIQQRIRDEEGLDKLPGYLLTQFLLDEIDYIKGRGVQNFEAYRTLARTGRGSGLDPSQRELVWRVFTEYEAALRNQELIDYADLPLKTLSRMESSPSPTYDAVIVDEAQDVSPMTLKVARRLTKNHRGIGLTLLADPAQSIYYQGIPWKEGDIAVSGGRTQPLEKNYRNTIEILEAARGVIEKCEELKTAKEYISPTCTNRHGPKPVLVNCDTSDEEASFVVGEILHLCQTGGYRLSDIVILARSKDALNPFKRRLGKENILFAHYRDEDFDILENQVKLITMHSAKGLEFPVVFLTGINDGVVPLASRLRSSVSSDVSAAIEQDRKLLYVSMTRASERLYITCLGRVKSPFLHDIHPETIRTYTRSSLPAVLQDR